MKRIIAALALCVLAAGLLSLVSWQTRRPSQDDARSARAGDELDAVAAPRWTERKKTKPLAARNPKPSKAQQQATEGELHAMELMEEGRFEEAAQVSWDDAMKPEPWLIEMRRKLGVADLYAPAGPTWDQLWEMGQHGTIDGKPVRKGKPLTKEENERHLKMLREARQSVEDMRKPKP